MAVEAGPRNQAELAALLEQALLAALPARGEGPAPTLPTVADRIAGRLVAAGFLEHPTPEAFAAAIQPELLELEP